MEDYEKKYKEALSRAATELETCGADKSLRNMIYAIFPDELKESEDEKIRKALIRFHKSTIDVNGIKGEEIIDWLEKQRPVTCNTIDRNDDEKIRKDCISIINAWAEACRVEGDTCEVAPECIAWLEKQGESYTKKDIDDAYLKGISDVKDELEKQGTPAKLSEEEQNSFAKGVLSNCALSFINYLDAHSYEGKMCVSNGECEDIDYAFHNAMWDRLHRYYCKYIEKQDEQKPILDFKASNFYVSKVDGKIHDITYNSTNKIEPKFKVGDYIVSDYCMGRVIEITNDAYLLDAGQGIPFSCENKVHLWTIQDAKDGDVLVGNKGDVILMFRRIGNTEWNDVIDYHCYYDCYWKDFIVQKDLQHWGDINNNQLKPATKEQRDLLFQKIKEAGYEWDADKKELKKLTQSVTKKSDKVWSEEDDLIVSSIEGALEGYEGMVSEDWEKEKEWLTSIKYRMQPQIKEWSEEDDRIYYSLLADIRTRQDDSTSTLEAYYNEQINWIKSLKDRITWKPSKKQMETLEYYMHTLLATEHKEVLFGLYNDLKKL